MSSQSAGYFGPISSSNPNNIVNNVAQPVPVNSQPFVTQTLKRRATKTQVPLDERVTLERAFGFTINSNTRLAQSCDGLIAYLAGCVIVLYDTVKQKQEFIISHARKTLTTVAFSLDGKLLATGESGHDPKVRVWDVKDKSQVCEFAGHKFSIDCVCFTTSSTNSSILVSIGSIHDMSVFVWNPKTKFKIASNKIACKVRGMAFSRDGSYFVTVGNRHVKFWYLTTSLLMETVPLKGRAAILGEYKNNYFCDVCCGSDEYTHQTYAITTNGVLCQFNENRCLCNTTDLKAERAYCLYADNGCLFVGCSNGNIHIFRQGSLQFITSLPRPHHLGVDVLLGHDMRHVFENMNKNELKYPDCIALSYNRRSQVITAVYNDHSLYVWDITDLNKVKKLDSHLYHSSCCWSIDMFTSHLDSQMNNSSSILPANSFITCSTDNTLRIWSPVSTSSTANTSTDPTILKPNIYSKELLKVIYIDDDLTALCDTDQSLLCETDPSQQQIMNPMVTSTSNSASNSASTNSTTPVTESKLGARCLKISPYGNHLATGDRNGNIRIYDLHSLQSICLLEAHEGEILYLQYSQPDECGYQDRLLLASSSRDRLIHIFDASSPRYDLIQTLDDHSAAITSVRFCYYNMDPMANSKQLCVISCGADKSIMFRNAVSQEPSLQFARTSYVAEKQTFYDLSVDSNKSVIYTIAQDRMIREYNVKDGKRVRQFKGSLNEDGSLVKMDLNKAGTLLAVSGSDKCIYIWDVNTTECVAYFCGHSEVVTDLKFSSDSRHLITVSTDGCIFVWKLSPSLYNLTGSTIQSHNPQQSHTQPQYHNYHHGGSAWSKSRTSSLSCHNNLYQIANSCSNSINLSSQVQAAHAGSTQTVNTNTVSSSNNNSHVNSLRHQQSLDTVLDHEFWQDLPAWARNKLAANNMTLSQTLSQSTNSLSLNTDDTITSTTTTTLNTDNMTTTTNTNTTNRKSRAMWGPPVLNTSFAVQYDQNNDLFETNSTSSMISNSVFHNETSFNNMMTNDTTQLIGEEDQEEGGSEFIKEMISSSVKIESEEEENNPEDEEVVELIQEDEEEEREAQVATIDDISSTSSTGVEIERSDSIIEKLKASPIQFPTPCIDKDSFHVRPVQIDELDTTIKSSWSNDNIASVLASTEATTLLSPRRGIQVEGATGNEASSDGKAWWNEAEFNLDCDFENSFRRQSLSARFMMKHQKNLSATISPSDIPNIDNEDQEYVKKECEPEQHELEDNTSQKSPRATISASSSTTVVTSPTINKSNHLYNQHTESSLSKSRLSSSRQPTASSMAKRWPSINSMSSQQSTSAGTTTSATTASSSISIKPVSTQHLIVNRTGGSSNIIKPHRTESSTSAGPPTQPVSFTARVSPSNLIESGPSESSVGPISLKKASSMTNVNATMAPTATTSNKQTFVSSRPLPAKMSNKDTMLPPKTTRTSLKTRTISNNLAKSQPAPVTLLSTFSEQNNKIKKLSSSIQNLHQNASNKHIMMGSKILSDREDDKKKETSSSQEDTDDQMSTASSQNMDDEDMMIKSSKQKEEENECCDLDQFTSNQLNSQNSMTTSSTSSSSSSSSSSSFCANEEASNTITAGTNSNLTSDNKSNLIDHDVNPFMAKKLTFKSRLTGELVVEPTESTIKPTSSGSSFAASMKSFKKPVTFASIATGSQNTINILGSAATSSSCSSSSGTSTGSGLLLSSSGAQCSNSLTNSKIETILKEFKENIYFFEMIYGQTAKNFEEYKKLHQTLPSQQTLQIMELFNTTCCSFVKQFKTVQQVTSINKSTSQQQQQANPSSTLTTFASSSEKMAAAKKQLDAEII